MKSQSERYAELKQQIARFVFGIRGERENPVSLRQILKHFYPADENIVGACLNDLLTDDRIDIRHNGPRTGHSYRQGFCYVPLDGWNRPC
jgi:hypothetical protein